MSEDSVELLAVALVREYLSRKGYKHTLSLFDKESQKKDDSIQNRRVLAENFNTSFNSEISTLEISQNNKKEEYPVNNTPRLVESDLDDSSSITSPHRNLSQHSRIPRLKSSSSQRSNSLNDLSPNSVSYLNGNDITSYSSSKQPSRKISIGERTIQSQRKSKQSLIKQASSPITVNGGIQTNKEDSFIENLRKQKEMNSLKSPQIHKKLVQNTPKSSTPMSSSQLKKQETMVDDDLIIMDDINSHDISFSLTKSTKHLTCVPLHDKTEPITLEIAIKLKELLFGSALISFNEEWKMQGFHFNDHPQLHYGLIQEKGGPCGLLAAVQACVIKEWLFSNNDIDRQAHFIQPLLKSDKDNLLINALTQILMLVRQTKQQQLTLIIVLPTPTVKISTNPKFKADKLTENLQLFHFTTQENLKRFLQENIHHFKLSKGCILFLYSLLLTSGIENIRNTMDETNMTLIGRHGYCTQEMVNLLLTGYAISNVFDGDVNLDQNILHGLITQNKIGFLSLFEHYNSCEVGLYYKNPVYPIWVVCSESHFSVLFSLDDITHKERKQFDLYYYDGLARQDEEIKLTVSIGISGRRNSTPGYLDLVPPLEQCIRTKWKGASVSWNETEPIL